MGIEYVKILATIGVAVAGWIIAYYFTSRKSRIDKKRDLSIEYLIRAYRFLSVDIVKRDISEEKWKEFESVIADIQLFGSENQVKLVKELVDEVVNGNEFELDPLINSLRTSLRKQLGLSLISGNVKWLRYQSKTIK